jgi:hypothetical protein
LSPEQVEALASQLSFLRHNVNNHLALVVAAMELIRRKPEMAPRFLESMANQPDKIIEEIRKFSDGMETALGIKQSS